MAWNRKGVTYVLTDVPTYEVGFENKTFDRLVGADPMDGFRSTDLVALVRQIPSLRPDSRVVSIFEETRTLHGGYMARLLWQEVRDE